VLLMVSAGAMGVGLCGLVATMLLGRAPVTGVARSLALIQQAVRPSEVARNDLPLGERFVRPFYGGMHDLAVRLAPSGTAARLNKMLDFAGNPPIWSVERLLGVKGAARPDA